jgi:hypothetical protein
LRFPSFQSPLVLPDNLRTAFRDKLEQFMVKHTGYSYLHEHEINHLQRLVDYLDVVKTPHSESFDLPVLLNDFNEFYSQYSTRRKKNFNQAFPSLSSWFELLP